MYIPRNRAAAAAAAQVIIILIYFIVLRDRVQYLPNLCIYIPGYLTQVYIYVTVYVIPVGSGSLRGARDELMEFSNGSACEIVAVAYCFPAAPPHHRLGSRGHGAAVNQLYYYTYFIYYIIIVIILRVTLEVHFCTERTIANRKSSLAAAASIPNNNNNNNIGAHGSETEYYDNNMYYNNV